MSWAWNFGGGGAKKKTNPTELQRQLLDRAAHVRAKLGERPPTYFPDNLEHVLFVSSSYTKGSDDGGEQQRQQHERGFCNWLIPHHLMVGQYPGQTPELGGANPHDVQQHLEYLVQDAGVRLFCSLQSELPAQTDDMAWAQKDGLIFLEPDYVRRQFPRPFTQYAPMVRDIMATTNDNNNSNNNQPIFLHAPIEDLNVPESQEPLQQLLLELLDFLCHKDDDDDDENTNSSCIYVHCWGGRGRAGLVGGCLLSLLWPCLDADQVLAWIQTGYATRLGHDQMSSALSTSPQTSQQRSFVRQFVQDYQQPVSYTHLTLPTNREV